MKQDNDFNEKELVEYVLYKSGLKISTYTAEKFYTALRSVIIEQLERNNRIKLEGLGVFYCNEVGGEDRFLPIIGETKYIEKKKNILFKPQSIFSDAVNGKFVSKDNKNKKPPKRKQKTKAEVQLETNLTENKTDIIDILEAQIKIKKDKIARQKIREVYYEKKQTEEDNIGKAK